MILCKSFPDHKPIVTTIDLEKEETQFAVTDIKYAFNKADWDELNKSILQEPFQPYCYSNVDELLKQWYEWLWKKIKKLIPRITKHRSQLPPWISNVTSNLMNKLKTRKKRKSVTLSKLIKLKRLEKPIKFESEKDLAEYEKSIFEGRTFSKIQKYLKCVRKTPSIPPTVNFDKTVASINVEKAEVFNQYFASVFSKSNMQPGYDTNNILNTANYTEEQISDILFELIPDKSTGPDKIGNTLLKKCHKTLCKSLKLIFRTCLKKQCYPSYWKICQITPIVNEGNKADVTCYRPISLLCCCSKVLEKLLFDKIYCFFHSKFHTSQYASEKHDRRHCN